MPSAAPTIRVTSTAIAPSTMPQTTLTRMYTIGFNGVRRSCRLQPCARSEATETPVIVLATMAPYTAIEIMIGTAADIPPWLTGTLVIAVFLFGRPIMTSIAIGKISVNTTTLELRNRRFSSTPRKVRLNPPIGGTRREVGSIRSRRSVTVVMVIPLPCRRRRRRR